MNKEIKIKLPIEINKDCQFLKDFDKPMMIQNSKSSMAYWNLMTTIIALEGYAKHGMKPNRHWKITDVKRYFGMNGSAKVLLNKLKYASNLLKSSELFKEQLKGDIMNK